MDIKYIGITRKFGELPLGSLFIDTYGRIYFSIGFTTVYRRKALVLFTTVGKVLATGDGSGKSIKSDTLIHICINNLSIEDLKYVQNGLPSINSFIYKENEESKKILIKINDKIKLLNDQTND